MGTVVLGKLESGSICKGQQLVMMPNKVRIHSALVHLSFLLKILVRNQNFSILGISLKETTF